MPDVSIIVKAKDEASKTLQGIGGSLGGLSKAFLGIGAVGGLALAGLAAGAMKLAVDAAKLEPIKITFDNLTKSIGSTSDAMLKKLRPATMGMLKDADLMMAANKMMAMGLADTEDEAARLAKMAVTLGTAMGVDATTSLENFSLMLANQSIPRLDTFGISSGKVRIRIEELMDATEGLTREQAFMQAVMEQGEESMGKVGDVSDTMAVRMQAVQATMGNLKDELGTALMPILEIFMDNVLSPLVAKISEWAPLITPVIEEFGKLAQKIINPEEGDWVEYLNTNVYDALEAAFGEEAAGKIVEFVEEGITELQKFVNDSVIPLVQKIQNEIIPAFRDWWESDGFKGVLNTLSLIGTAIGGIITKAGELKEAMDDLLSSPGMKWLIETLGKGAPEWQAIQMQQGGQLGGLLNLPNIGEQYWAGQRAGQYQEAYSQQGYVLSGGTTNVNVYGLPGLEEEVRDIIRRSGGRE